MMSMLVRNLYAQWIDDKQAKIPRVACLPDCSVYVLVAETVTDDHHSCIWSQEVFPKLFMIPFQNQMLVDRGGFVSSHHDQFPPSAGIDPIAGSMELEIRLQVPVHDEVLGFHRRPRCARRILRTVSGHRPHPRDFPSVPLAIRRQCDILVQIMSLQQQVLIQSEDSVEPREEAPHKIPGFMLGLKAAYCAERLIHVSKHLHYRVLHL